MSTTKLLRREAKLRAQGLLDMLYSPSDLAEELGIDMRVVYEQLVPAGIPHTKDDTKHLWFHGPAVARWVRELAAKRSRLRPNEVYCLKCRAVVPLINPNRVVNARFTVLKALCPRCGSKVNRGIKSHDQP